MKLTIAVLLTLLFTLFMSSVSAAENRVAPAAAVERAQVISAEKKDAAPGRLVAPTGDARGKKCGMHGDTVYANACGSSFISSCKNGFTCHDPIANPECNYGECRD